MACVAVTSLMRTIELEFMQPQPRPIVQQKELFSCNKDLIQSLHQKLGSLMELFDEKRMDGVEAIKHLETKLRDVAFRVEDEIEFQVAHLYVDKEEKQGDTDAEKKLPFLRLRHILEQSIEDIDAIKEELVKVNMEYKHAIASQGRKTTVDAFTKSDEVLVTGDFSRHASHSEDSMIGKNNDFKTIKEMLIKHPSKQREVVSIEGMGGIGKKTLARRVYEDHTVASHFDKRAWVVASQLHNKRQMLVSLLNSMGDEESESDESDEEFSLQRKKSDEKLALQLYKRLKCQRYLVVMDDVWSRDAWDVVKACFPDDRNGSRLLMTTRLAKVANYIRFDNDFSLQMQLLNQSESWNLFCDKAGRSCSAEFEMIGRPIVEKCKGLPLAIIVVAGLFSKLNTLDEWKNIAETLNSLAKTTVDEECSRILSLSYNHLLHNLKACFLYLGVFPEDHEINVNELARLWSAEGLLKAFKDKSFDVVAKRYIQELMDRNLILVSK